ncbi:MAG TPA: hypothetical protein ACHBX6_02380 [Arsenophonus nasoniae]|uniref:phage tail fiber protein n=1 Tax=Arsenophonus nasoniae TaxID=638 RepID=UPI003879BE40
MLIKNGDINYPYMILAVNSDTELTLADKPTFSATDTTYTINLTEPNNNSDAARALVAANTYIIYFLQNMDLWMTENGVVEVKTPSGKTVKLESIKALQELVEGKADATKVDEISKSVTEISKTVENKLDKINIVQVTGSATDKVMSQKASTDILAKKNSNENLNCGNLKVQTSTDYTSIIFAKGDKTSVMLETSTSTFNLIYRDSNNTNQSVIRFPFGVNGIVQLSSSFTIDSNGYLKRASPIVKIHPDGNFETNDESEGVNVQRTGVGSYFISGVMGYNSDGGWGINDGVSVPKNSDGLELIYIKDKILPDGNIEIQTFHRQHSHLPEEFQNWRIKEIVDGKPTYYVDGEQVDIPMSTWLDVRVEMPPNSVWHQKQEN